jgi:class 3 adenylate cyclase
LDERPASFLQGEYYRDYPQRNIFMHLPRDESRDAGASAVNRVLEIAHVLFMDIVSYSLLPMDVQSRVMSHLQDVVRRLPGFEQAVRLSQLICLPTGDGMALAFFGDLMVAVEWARKVALELQSNPQFQLRMGIHTGPVYRVADINANLNVAGGGINFAQRVMDCGDAGHILMSNATAEILIQLSTWHTAIHDLGELEVKHGIRIHVFNFFDDEFGNRDMPSKVKRAADTALLTEPNLGQLVAKMCNRRTQEAEFNDTFLDGLERLPDSPQIYFILGEEGQCHESLVERLIDRVDRSRGADGRGEIATGRVKKIPWQYEGEIGQRRSRLVYSLFEHLGPNPARQPIPSKDCTSAGISDLLAASLNAYIVVQHELRAARWDSFAVDLLKKYVQFWSELPQETQRPVVLVFISIIFPRAQLPSWTRFLLGAMTAKWRKKRIWNALKTLEEDSAVPCRVLAELPSIIREDVLEWFSLHNIYDTEEKRMRAVDRLFQGGALRLKAMWEIEAFCAEELQRFAAERGFDDRWQRHSDAPRNQTLFRRGSTRFEAQSSATAV